MTPVWACRAFRCFQLPIYANSYIHVSLKLPSVTLFHITHYYILIHIKYPHKLSLIFHHLMFISFHTMLLYIVFCSHCLQTILFFQVISNHMTFFKITFTTWHTLFCFPRISCLPLFSFFISSNSLSHISKIILRCNIVFSLFTKCH